jgi:hypothetical protein
LAAALRKEPGVDVDLGNGNKGEFTVSVNGQVVARKDGDSMPSNEEVLAAVRNAGAAAGART